MASQTDSTFDAAAYRENTAALVDSMDRTTDLVGEMADNMDDLSVAFERFGSSTRRVATDGGRRTDD